MALIDKNDLLHEITQDVHPEGNQRAAQLLEAIANAPEVDPVHAAGGCYCRECKDAHVSRYEFNNEIYDVKCRKNSYRKVEPDGFCKWGRRREGADG